MPPEHYEDIEEEPGEKVMIAEAVEKALEAFNSHLSDRYGVDPSYYHVHITVEFLSSGFETVLEKMIFEDLR